MDLSNFNKIGNSFIINNVIDVNNHELDILFLENSLSYSDISLIGEINFSGVFSEFDLKQKDYFNIWELFKKNADIIYLSTYIDHTNKILDWKRNNSTPIELSIVLPIYNVAEYLELCINKLTEWDTDILEIIAVNDGSPDSSLDILEKLRKKDDRIVIINKENGGCASARQKGLEVARGRYVGFVDPDDYTTPDMFYQLLKKAMLGNYEVSYTGYSLFYEKSERLDIINDDAIHWPYSGGTYDKKLIEDLIINQRVAIWRGIYRKDFLENKNITFNTSLRRYDDLPFKIEVCTHAKAVVSIDEYHYFYRLERPGQDVLADDERLYVHFDIFKYLDDKIVKKVKNKRITDLIQISKINTHYWALKKIKPQFKKEYKKRAKIDILANMSFLRSLMCVINYRGRQNLEQLNSIFF